MRFLVDECLPLGILDVLIELEHDAIHVLRSDLRSHPDRAIWQFAATTQRVVITADLDYPLPDLPRPPGLIILRFPTIFSRESIVALFCDFAQDGGLLGAVHSIVVVRPGKTRIRPFPTRE